MRGPTGCRWGRRRRPRPGGVAPSVLRAQRGRRAQRQRLPRHRRQRSRVPQSDCWNWRQRCRTRCSTQCCCPQPSAAPSAAARGAPPCRPAAAAAPRRERRCAVRLVAPPSGQAQCRACSTLLARPAAAPGAIGARACSAARSHRSAAAATASVHAQSRSAAPWRAPWGPAMRGRQPQEIGTAAS